MKNLIIVVIYVLLLTTMCDTNPVSSTDDSAFSIHLLKDHSLTISKISEKDINELKLEEKAWIASEDIDFYDYSSHCIYLKSNKSTYFTKELGISLNDQPFVILAYNIRCYLGSFHSGAMSLAPHHPYIDEMSISFFPSDVLYIAPSWNRDIEDERNNTYVEQALRNMNKLHHGLSLTVNEIQVIDNSDTATVRYTYALQNNDQDDLYVLDPEKMGTKLFHYYTNGINFRSETKYIYSEYKSVIGPEPFDSWQSDWFSKLNAGQSMERTIIIKGYPHIPNDQYSCTFQFSSPMKVEKDDRYINDGRIWIGEIQSNAQTILVQ